MYSVYVTMCSNKALKIIRIYLQLAVLLQLLLRCNIPYSYRIFLSKIVLLFFSFAGCWDCTADSTGANKRRFSGEFTN